MTNIVLLMSDSHNPRVMSPGLAPDTHRSPVHTPNLDRLAEAGTVFENTYCPSPLCVPSRSAFMTGRWVHEIQRYNNSKVIEGRWPGYGQALADAGVHTVFLGSAGNLYRDPYDLGFSELQLVNRTERPLSLEAIRTDSPSSPVPPRTEAEHGPRPDRYAEDIEYVDAAVQWLHDTAPGIATPWTLTVNIHPPHPPYTTDAGRWDAYADRADLPLFGADEATAQHPFAEDLRTRGGWQYSDNTIRGIRRSYYGAIDYVDAELGRLMDAVDAAGHAENTVVCYTTDHGEMLGKFGLWGKCSLYEDSVRIPLIAAGPGFTPAAHVRTPVSLLDLQAALFRAVGAPRPQDWHGDPLQDVPVDDPTRSVFAEYHGHGVRGSGYLLRRGDWKLLYNIGAPHQLFNLADDPDELSDLWEDRPDVAGALERELRTFCDPEVEARRASAFAAEQRKVIDSWRAQLGPDATHVPWE